jgi:glycosyltransferase involved in cell wall biosynthesis
VALGFQWVLDIPGCNELIADGENGYFPKFGDVQAAADAIDRLLSDEGLYDRFSKEAVLRFQKNHDVADYAPRYIKAYKKAIAARKY